METKSSHILIVDDMPANLELLMTVLQRAGYVVHVATSGREALAVTLEIRPDLILMDVMMPEMDGFETCRRLKAIPDVAEIPVVFLTARTDTESITIGFDSGGADYATKPFLAEELLVARVQTHLKRAALSVSLRELQEPRAVLDSRIHVLMVDDQRIMREAVHRMLGGEEDIVLTHHLESINALERIREIEPSVLLIDLVMPDIDGFELLRRLRKDERTRDIPIIMLSSDSEVHRKVEAFESGANDFLVKMPDRLELVARIRALAAKGIAEGQLRAMADRLQRQIG
jgi:two-component system cell cycle response regulator